MPNMINEVGKHITADLPKGKERNDRRNTGGGQRAPKECSTCGERYLTEQELGKHRRLHCGNKEENGFGETQEMGK